MALSKVIGEGLGAVDSLTVDTNTLFVDAANNKIGVGTTTPDTYSDYVSGSLTTGLAIAGSFPGIQLADTDVSGSNSTFGISKAGQSTTVNNLGTGSIKFYTAGGQRVNITENGLTFNGDTAAANALDDYEEGTFTPSFIGGLTGSSYGDQNGTYVKIGQLVFFVIELDITNGQASTNGNQIKIDNIPFVSAAASPMIYGQGGAWVIFNNNFYNVDTGIYLQIPTNTNQIRLYRGSGNALVGTDTGLNGQNDLHIAGCYRTA